MKVQVRRCLPRLATLAALVLCAGCSSLAPRPEPVSSAVATRDLALQAPFTAGEGAPQATDADLRWWHRFDDPQLAAWVERALASNVEIAIAETRIAQARALLRAAQAARGPRVDAQADLTLRLRQGASAQQQRQRRLQPGAGLALEFDADPWGGLRLAESAAAAGVLRSAELREAARLGTAALAARGYIAWRLALHDHAVLGDNAAILREALRIARVRVEAGIAPVLDRDRAEAELASTQAAQAAAAVRAGQARAALQVLAGERPQALAPPLVPQPDRRREGERLEPLPSLEGTQPVVQPLDLLRLRPDLRAAEQALVAAAAEVGVARTALLPRLRLPGAVVLGAAVGGGAFELVSATLAGLVEAPLFDGGAAQAQVQSARARAREAELVWRQSLLEALQQVESALLARQGALVRIDAARRSAAAARAAEAQAQTLYRAGLTGFLDVVDAQRTLQSSERLLLQARADAATASVDAFEALGLLPVAQAQ
ncbi:efflux transporter outer membrane subunit [Ramlibacter sp. AN1015]|uniref:efflux transporter outer membrane subunit n=1 Tax=Ramlibacter sp. AN1015 TaxID=3133428 RepID=UPI0030BA7373